MIPTSRVLVDGPAWAGRWTECIAQSLHRLGYSAQMRFHNHKTLSERVSNRIARMTGRLPPGLRLGTPLAQRSNQALRARMAGGGWTLLICIQGKIDRATVERLRQDNPGLRVVFWWGDILTERARQRLDELRTVVDQVLVSYRGDVQLLRGEGFERVYYFPFGVYPPIHAEVEVSQRDRRKYGCDVAFVGTCYENRCELIQFLNKKLAKPVAVWGRSWRRCRSVPANGAVDLAEAQKIHACAKISLNLHHVDTNDGVNMKYFEIPAAGGFQIVDWQPLMDTASGNRGVATFTDRHKLVDLIEKYLRDPEIRRARASEARALVLAEDSYTRKLASLLTHLESLPASTG